MATPILTPADIAALKNAIQQAEHGKQICQQGAACGFDMSGHESILHELQRRLTATLHQFGQKGASPS